MGILPESDSVRFSRPPLLSLSTPHRLLVCRRKTQEQNLAQWKTGNSLHSSECGEECWFRTRGVIINGEQPFCVQGMLTQHRGSSCCSVGKGGRSPSPALCKADVGAGTGGASWSQCAFRGGGILPQPQGTPTRFLEIEESNNKLYKWFSQMEYISN